MKIPSEKTIHSLLGKVENMPNGQEKIVKALQLMDVLGIIRYPLRYSIERKDQILKTYYNNFKSVRKNGVKNVQ